MAACSLSALRWLVCVFGFCFISSLHAASLAPEGATGVLQIEVRVEGSGSETAGPGAGLESRSWSVSNHASYELSLASKAPVIGGESTSAAAEPADNAAWEAEWEAKMAACKGDELCEMQVAMAQASDPRAVQQMQGLSEMMSIARSSPGAAPTAQVWDTVARSGRVTIQQRDNALGVIAETGGKVDVLCTIGADQRVASVPQNPYGMLPPVLTVNGTTANYTLHLPLEEDFALSRRCSNGSESWEDALRHTVRLIGDSPIDASSWSTVLTAEGTVDDNGGNLSFAGRKVFQATVLDSSSRIARVTIEWRFNAPAPGS